MTSVFYPNWYLHQTKEGKALVAACQNHAKEINQSKFSGLQFGRAIAKVKDDQEKALRDDILALGRTGISRQEYLALASGISLGLETALNAFSMYLATGQKTVSVSKSLWEAFSETELNGLFIDHFDFPFECFYLPLEGCDIDLGTEDNPVPMEGMMVSRFRDLQGLKALRINLIPKAQCQLHPSKYLPSIVLKGDIYNSECPNIPDLAVDLEIDDLHQSRMQVRSTLPQEMWSIGEERSKTLIEIQTRLAPVYKKVFNIVFNAVAYMSAYPSELGESAYSDRAPGNLVKMATAGTQKEQTRAGSKLESLGFRPYFKVGNRFEKELHEAFSRSAEGARPHIRRGHWVRQAYGPEHSLRKLQWRLPCLVNAKIEQLPSKSIGLKL